MTDVPSPLPDGRTGPLAPRVEHALLGPAVTPADVDAAAVAASAAGLAALLVWPAQVAQAVQALKGTGVDVVAVVGGPYGASLRDTKIDEARRAMVAGARELAVVVDAGTFRGGQAGPLAADVVTTAYLAHAEGVDLRAVLQAHLLHEQELVIAGRLAAESGADRLQTGLGLDAPATVGHAQAARRALPPRQHRLPVVAGGAPDAAAARQLLGPGRAWRVTTTDPAALLAADERSTSGDGTTGDGRPAADRDDPASTPGASALPGIDRGLASGARTTGDGGPAADRDDPDRTPGTAGQARDPGAAG